jgi:hypothetical protein
MKAVFCGLFTGHTTVKIISRNYNPIFKNWSYLCKATGKSNRFYKTGVSYYFNPADLCLKVSFKNRGNAIVKSGYIDPELIQIGANL